MTATGNTGIADHDVHDPEFSENRIDQGLDRYRIINRRLECGGPASGGGDFLDGRDRGRGVTPVVHSYRGTGVSKAHRDLLANAAAAAGDERGATGQLRHHASPRTRDRSTVN
jgi:hypothetical protein